MPSVRQVGQRYLEAGVEVALKDAKRPAPPRRLAPHQEAAIVALACRPPPPGRARWTIALIVQEAIARKINITITIDDITADDDLDEVDIDLAPGDFGGAP